MRVREHLKEHLKCPYRKNRKDYGAPFYSHPYDRLQSAVFCLGYPESRVVNKVSSVRHCGTAGAKISRPSEIGRRRKRNFKRSINVAFTDARLESR